MGVARMGGVVWWAGRRARGRGLAEAGRRREPGKENGGLVAHFGRGPPPPPLACPALCAVQPPELPMGNLPQSRFSAEVGVHTSGTEWKPASTKNPSHRPLSAQALCEQTARPNPAVEGATLDPAPRACATVHAHPLVWRVSQRPELRRRGALGRIPVKTQSWVELPAQTHFEVPPSVVAQAPVLRSDAGSCSSSRPMGRGGRTA